MSCIQKLESNLFYCNFWTVHCCSEGPKKRSSFCSGRSNCPPKEQTALHPSHLEGRPISWADVISISATCGLMPNNNILFGFNLLPIRLKTDFLDGCTEVFVHTGHCYVWGQVEAIRRMFLPVVMNRWIVLFDVIMDFEVIQLVFPLVHVFLFYSRQDLCSPWVNWSRFWALLHC